MSVKRLLPLQPLNVETHESDFFTKTHGWIPIDKVCAEMCLSQKSTFISGNLRIVQKGTEAVENKENISSSFLPIEKPQNPQKSSESQIPNKLSQIQQGNVIKKFFSIALETESELCSEEFLRDRSSPHITDSMRSKLLSWLTEVCENFELTREVFFLSVDILDRYLASEGALGLRASNFQLVGISCLFISAKYESVDLCEVEKYASMTDGAFTAKEVVNMELRVLQTLDWNLNVVSSYNWLKIFLQLHEDSLLTTEKPNYSCYNLLRGAKLLSAVLFDPCCFLFPRSLIAGTIFMMLTRRSKNEEWKNLTCHSNSDLKACFRVIFPTIRPEIPTLSSLGYQAFKCRDSTDHHDLQLWEPLRSQKKRFCNEV